MGDRARSQGRGMTDETRPERAAANQSAFRELNDELEAVSDDGLVTFLCECADTSCAEFITLPRAAYERVRENGTWFVVAPAALHVIGEAEVVVERHPSYWVVSKIGTAGDVAEDLAT